MKKKAVLGIGMAAIVFLSSIFNGVVNAAEDEKPLNEDANIVQEMEEAVGGLEEIEIIETNEQEVPPNEVMDIVDGAEEQDVERQEVKANNQKYIVENYEVDGKKYVVTYSQDKTSMSVICLEGNTITTKNYTFDPVLQKYTEETVVLRTDDENGLIEQNDEVMAQKIKYNSKVVCKLHNKSPYYYQTGKEGKKTYLKIGCKANYRIRTDNLTTSKDKKCSAYQSAIKKCNSNRSKALASLVGTEITFVTLLALVVANISFPPSVIVTTVVSVVGGGTGVIKAVYATIDAEKNYQDVKDYYAVIKTYGKNCNS